MYIYPKKYEVIVVGAGHAGVEAALAAARMGCKTLLFTMNVDSIGQMSCNPAIGGLGKGHLVREIDALGGEMGITTDLTGIQFKMLNKRKGPAVWAPRAQCDKKAYQSRLKWICETEQNLDVKQGHIIRIVCEHGKAVGIETNIDVRYEGHTTVITTGTFLRGLMHIGSSQQSGGRAGDSTSINLSDSLKQIGLELSRLKTGTPPRLLRRTIDFSKTQAQFGDESISYFSHWFEKMFHVEHTLVKNGDGGPCLHRFLKNSILERIGKQSPCYITYTTAETARLIKTNLHRSPLYTGMIEGIGPRYCPSIEDKIVKFSEKERHQIFLEPEGFQTDEIYVNGLSTSLPFEIQVDLVRTIVGCENAEIIRPAYAVEYDFADPRQLYSSLETKVCRNLFLAGQINGTSGYEEAAAQGIMAGINAARKVKNLDPIVLGREQAYIGVLVDDLTTKGTREPYRMFTSRGEHRLLLRQDNADLRLSSIGHQIGLISGDRHKRVMGKMKFIENEVYRLETTYYNGESLSKILSRPEMSYKDLPNRNTSITEEVAQQVEIMIKYAGYIKRQEIEAGKLKDLENKCFPDDFSFVSVPSLRLEARQKLSEIRPRTIGQAARISGVSPADISIIAVFLKRHRVKPTPNDLAAEGEGL